ncbi:MAG: hypothetical protein IJ428_05815 [Clostridia bacterium]|nr:hypothetical protein [Clostridia bacterium]
MNIIETVRALLLEFPKIGEVCNSVHVDFTEPQTDSYALASSGDSLVGEDIVGNPTRQHTFVLYSYWQSASDFDRLNNSGVMLELAQWLEKRGKNLPVTAEYDGAQYKGITTAITCSNGMLFAIPETLNGGVQYQLQIIAQYKLFTEV